MRVLRWAGYVEETERGRGSHVIYYHPDFPHLDLVLPSSDPVRIYIVKRLLQVVDELNEQRST
ncbi:MAG: type II toxin-antitoxin system HicA family toxin [Anaerolineae bacterium]|nr:type II toxin-antitoxin system HicA family toxin [Anaerolineae bacterium]